MRSADLWTLLLVVMAYLVCGIPFGMLIARARGVDVRQTGSGNIGATNVGRSVGAGAAALTLALDAGKGLVCMALAWWVLGHSGLADIELKSLYVGEGANLWRLSCVYAACVLGHVFSPYLHFHGGKGISVGFGAALGFYWPIGVGLLAVFLIFAIPSRHVSLGSVCAAVSLPFICLGLGFRTLDLIPIVLVCVAVVWAHRSNIKKLVNHEEKPFSFHHGDSAAAGDKHDVAADDKSDGGEKR